MPDNVKVSIAVKLMLEEADLETVEDKAERIVRMSGRSTVKYEFKDGSSIIKDANGNMQLGAKI